MRRKRCDGTIGYVAQVRVKRKGKLGRAEARSFARKLAGGICIARRETGLRQPRVPSAPRR